MKLFKRSPKLGNLYAVQTGDFAGEFLIFIEKSGTNYCFLAAPLMSNRTVPVEKFDFAIKESIIEFVERVPAYVRKTSKAKWLENQAELRTSS